jgi:hypothetical protein
MTGNQKSIWSPAIWLSTLPWRNPNSGRNRWVVLVNKLLVMYRWLSLKTLITSFEIQPTEFQLFAIILVCSIYLLFPCGNRWKHPTKEIAEHPTYTYKEEPVSFLVIWRPEQQLLGLISVTIELSLFVTNFVKVNLQVCWHWFSYLSWLLRRIKSFSGRCIGFLIRHQIISGTRWFRMKPIGFVMATYLHSRPSRCQYTQTFWAIWE